MPIVGVGDLLRYNVGEPRPVKTFYLMALKDVMGNDRVGASVYFTLDDLGTQRTLIFSRETCLDPYLLLYEEMIDHCHSLGMHLWLHACGTITDLLDDFVSVKLDVLHLI